MGSLFSSVNLNSYAYSFTKGEKIFTQNSGVEIIECVGRIQHAAMLITRLFICFQFPIQRRLIDLMKRNEILTGLLSTSVLFAFIIGLTYSIL
jgi:hypothetical protein